MPASTPLISVIGPVHNEQHNLAQLHEGLGRALAPITADYEIIYIDDGSRDDSVRVIESLMADDPRTKLIELSRNFGKEAAMLAGYDHAIGRAVVVIDTDLQTPPDVLPEMIEKWRNGADIVDAVRESTVGQGLLRRATSSLFYWAMRRLANTDIVANSVDFRLLDRKVVDELVRCRERFRFNRGLAGWLGFRRTSVTFVAAQRGGGESGWGLPKLAGYAMDALLSFSSLPLRLAGVLGLFVSMLSLLYLVFLLFWRVIVGQPTPGYATIVGGIFFLGGTQLLTIWLLGEYVGRLYDESKGRPLYVVARILTSDAPTAPAAAHEDRPSS